MQSHSHHPEPAATNTPPPDNQTRGGPRHAPQTTHHHRHLAHRRNSAHEAHSPGTALACSTRRRAPPNGCTGKPTRTTSSPSRGSPAAGTATPAAAGEQIDDGALRHSLDEYGRQHHQFDEHLGRRDATWNAVVHQVRQLAANTAPPEPPADRFGRAPQSWHTRRDGHLPGVPVQIARCYVAERWYPSPGRDLGGRQLIYAYGRWRVWNRGQWTEPASTTARPDELADPIAEDIAEWISDAHVAGRPADPVALNPRYRQPHPRSTGGECDTGRCRRKLPDPWRCATTTKPKARREAADTRQPRPLKVK